MRSRIHAAALAVAIAGAAVAAPAGAHTSVTKRTPPPGAVAGEVRTVKVAFGASMVTGLIEITRNGSTVAPVRAGMTRGNRVLRARFARPLRSGSYRVSWRARAGDGHSQSGAWTFRVR